MDLGGVGQSASGAEVYNLGGAGITRGTESLAPSNWLREKLCSGLQQSPRYFPSPQFSWWLKSDNCVQWLWPQARIEVGRVRDLGWGWGTGYNAYESL